MKIVINENFEIDCDGIQFVLSEKYTGKDKNGNIKEQIENRYYPSLESCCKILIDKMILSKNQNNKVGVSQILESISKAQYEILNAIKDAGLTIKEIYGRKI